MIKKCKQCGQQLKPGESNNVCENCRQLKRNNQEEARLKREQDKRKKRQFTNM